MMVAHICCQMTWHMTRLRAQLARDEARADAATAREECDRLRAEYDMKLKVSLETLNFTFARVYLIELTQLFCRTWRRST